jgi:hypothetical protein
MKEMSVLFLGCSIIAVEALLMRWLKSDMEKAAIALVGMLLLLVLMVWVPVSAAGAYEGVSRLATPVTGTVQATPTEDATVTALNKEKLAQEVQQLKNQNDRSTAAWFWNSSGLLGPIVAALLAVAGVLWTAKVAQDKNLADRQAERTRRDEEQKRWLEDRKAERERRDEEQQRWLKNQEAERDKRAEERFQSVVVGLGSEREEAKASAAIMLRTFLQPDYEQFYRQAFDLAVTHLRLRKVDPNIPDPSIPYKPPDSLSQALITVLKESFPLAREKLRKQLEAEMLEFDPALLDATGSHLEYAYLSHTDLKKVYLRHAFLQGAHFWQAHLEGANLKHSNLTLAFLEGAHLEEANLGDTKLMRAKMKGAYLCGTHLANADLTGADLTGTHPEDAGSLTKTILHDVEGLNPAQRSACAARGAIL